MSHKIIISIVQGKNSVDTKICITMRRYAKEVNVVTDGGEL